MKRLTKGLGVVACFCVICLSLVLAQEHEGYKPKNGFVPDEKTAAKIAEAVWIPIYGEEEILRQKPFKVELEKGIWVVKGSLKKGYVGGGAMAEIAKKDGRIIKVWHGR